MTFNFMSYNSAVWSRFGGLRQRAKAPPWLRVGLIVSAALGMASPVFADDTPPKESKDKAVEVVVTGTRMPEQSQRATIRVDVVTRKEAERRGATNVAEAISGQLGVQVNPAAYGDIGNPSAIQIQGLDRQRVLILEDGERVIGDVGGAIDLSRMPLADVARVEVVAGPMSSLYGTSAIGGVVNVITGQPLDTGFSGRLRLEGRNRRGFIAQGNAAWRGERSWATFDGNFVRTDGVALQPGSIDLALPDRQQALLGVRLGTQLSSRIRVQSRFRWIRDESEGRQTQIVPGLGPFRIDLPQETNRFAAHIVELVDLGGGSSLRLALGQQWAFDTTQKDRFESPIDESRERKSTLSSIEATMTLANGPKRTWVVGFRGEVERLAQSLSKTEYANGQLQTAAANELPPTMLGSVAAYAQLGWKLADSFTVLLGGRGEVHLRYGAVAVPRLSIAYRMSPNVSFRGSVGRGFRAPAAKEIGFAFDHGSLGYRVIGNPNLQPETSWGTSGDISVRPIKDLQLRGGIFANWIDQMIDIDIKPTSTTGGIDDYTYRNIGRARTFGGQIDAAWTVTKRFRAEVGYSYLWTRDDENQRPLEGRPPHTVFSAIRADLPWKLELVARYRMVTDAFLDENLRAPGFQTLDARLARPLWKSIQIYAGLLNALGVQKDPSRLGDQRPAQGRTIYIGLTAEYPPEE